MPIDKRIILIGFVLSLASSGAPDIQSTPLAMPFPLGSGVVVVAPLSIECKAEYSLWGHKIGSDRPDECGHASADGPEFPPFELYREPITRTFSDDNADINMEFTRPAVDAAAMLRVRPKGRATYPAVVRGPLSSVPLELSGYLGERTASDRPECSFSHYVTVRCSLKR